MPGLDTALPLPHEEQLGVALVGLGAYTLNQILPNLPASRRCRLAALVSGNEDKARTVARAYGLGERHVYNYDTFDRIAEDQTVDVVYILLPNTMHRDWTERSFAAGKHVLCEKPMAATVADCEAMIAAGRTADRKLMIGYRAQFDPYNLRAIDLVRGDNRQIGTPRIAVGNHGRMLDLSDSRDGWRAKRDLAGGGSLFDIGIYSLNGVRYLLGEEPTEVTARFMPRSGRSEVEVEEGVAWSMLFPSGAVANCTSSYLIEGVNRLQVQGSEGTVTLDPATKYYVRHLILTRGRTHERIVIPNTNQFAAMFDELAEAIREDREPKASGTEGLRDVRIMEAIYESAEQGRSVSLI